MFKQVAVACKRHKRDFKAVNKTSFIYDRKPFQLDRKLEVDIEFLDRAMKTDVYVKMDAAEPLLPSEGVCSQLGIVTYHPEVEPTLPPVQPSDVKVSILAVKVRLVDSIKLPPDQTRVLSPKLLGNEAM